MSLPGSGNSASGPAPGAAGRRPGRGLVESTQWALLIPVLLIGIFGVIQAGLYLAGRSAVQQAAMAGAEHAAFAGAGPTQASQVATDLATRAGLNDVSVSVETNGAGVQVWVQARVETVLPGDWTLVEASAYRAKEG